MRRHLKIAGMLLLTFSIHAGQSTGSETHENYAFGVVPQFNARMINSIWRPLLDEIERLSGLHFQIRGSSRIPSFEQELLCGEFDFAYVNPYQMLFAGKSPGYIPLVRDNGRALRGVIVVRNDSLLTRVPDLQRHTVAFPSPNALGATLLVRSELQHDFNVEVKPVYVQTDSSVYLNVALGETAAGGGEENTLERQPEALRSQLRILHRTRPVAPNPVVAHPRIESSVSEQVRRAFLQMGRSEYGRRLLSRVPVREIGSASMADYEVLRQLKLGSPYECS